MEIIATRMNKKFIAETAKKFFPTAKRTQKFKDDLTKITVIRFYDSESKLLGKVCRENNRETARLDIK